MKRCRSPGRSPRRSKRRTRRAIIHRDLKPANIKVAPDGTVKVLDFGLAKAMDPTGVVSANVSQSPTITSPAMMTRSAIILGTAAYMSPEQARGKPVDKRTDIWAFGCVLYEMLTGQRAFAGDDVSDTLASVLKKEPEWGALPAGCTPTLIVYLKRCLYKDSKQRLGDMHDVRLALEGAFETEAGRVPRLVGRGLGEGGSEPPRSAGSAGLIDADRAYVRLMRPRVALVGAAAVVVTGSIVGAAVWMATRPAPPRVVRTEITTAGVTALSFGGFDRDLAITPDGSRIVYRGANQLLVRALDQLEPDVPERSRRAAGPLRVARWPVGGVFDGTQVLKKVAISGGPPVTLATVDGSGPSGATWGPDDTIVYATNLITTGLTRVSAGGGESSVLTKPDPARGEGDHVLPEFLPGGQAVLFTILPVTGGLDAAQIAVLDLRTNVQTVLARGGSDAHYVPTGHLVYAAGGTLRSVAFDVERLAVVGTSAPVLEQVMVKLQGAANAAIAANGTLVSVTGSGDFGEGRSLLWVDRKGGENPIPAPVRPYMYPRISPDGRRIVVHAAGQEADLWVWDVDAHHADTADVRARPGLHLRVDARRPTGRVQLSKGRECRSEPLRAGR